MKKFGPWNGAIPWVGLPAALVLWSMLPHPARGQTPPARDFEVTLDSRAWKCLPIVEESRLRSADGVFAAGKYTEAAAAYAAFRDEFTNSAAIPYVWLRQGRCLHLAGRRPEALAMYGELRHAHPQPVDMAAAALFYSGQAHAERGEKEEAQRAYAALSAREDYRGLPCQAAALFYIGQAHAERGEKAEAQRMYAALVAQKKYRGLHFYDEAYERLLETIQADADGPLPAEAVAVLRQFAVEMRARRPEAAYVALGRLIRQLAFDRPDEDALRRLYLEAGGFGRVPLAAGRLRGLGDVPADLRQRCVARATYVFDVSWPGAWRAGDLHQGLCLLFKGTDDDGDGRALPLLAIGTNAAAVENRAGADLEWLVAPDRSGLLARLTRDGRGDVAARHMKAIFDLAAAGLDWLPHDRTDPPAITMASERLSLGMRGDGSGLTNVTATRHEPPDGKADIVFDLAWTHSWRNATNHDALWVFFKYAPACGPPPMRGYRQARKHVRLAGTGLNPPGYSPGQGADLELLTPPDGMGVFARRASAGEGDVAATQVRVVWDLAGVPESAFPPPGAGGPAPAVALQGFAVEMALVPEGPFWLGSASNETAVARFAEGGGTPGAFRPFRIESEKALAIGDACGQLWQTLYPGSLWKKNKNHQGGIGAPGLLPAAFPKGYAAFYCMKYELTQGAYTDFLNTLTKDQARERAYLGPLRAGHRNSIRQAGAWGYVADAPRHAANLIGWADLTAWLDWAALRPMTEFEYEKAGRGPEYPVAGERVWGTTNIVPLRGLAGIDGSGTETPLPIEANCCMGLSVYVPAGPRGPVRVDLFAAPGRTREQSGASYWGILGLAGNVQERPICVANEHGRAFTGAHGDGELDANGRADAPCWCGTGPVPAGRRGGDWLHGVPGMLAERGGANYTFAGPCVCTGGRGVRTVP